MFCSYKAIFWSSYFDNGVWGMVTIEFGEWFSNASDGFTESGGLENENNGLSCVELRSF